MENNPEMALEDMIQIVVSKAMLPKQDDSAAALLKLFMG